MTGMRMIVTGSFVALMGALLLVWTYPTSAPTLRAWITQRGWQRWLLPVSFALLGVGLVLQLVGGLHR